MRADVLSGRHAIVTGASRGIGAAIAARLAEAGAATILIGRDATALADRERQIPNSRSVVCDVTDAAQVEKVYSELLAHAQVDILVNNAGAAESAPFAKTSDSMLERMLSVNLHSAFRCSRAVLPAMLARGYGRIVNISSIAGLRGYPYVTAYVAAKHALVGFSRALAMELAQKGITVNAVCPGYTDTELVRGAASAISAKTGRSEGDVVREMIRTNPLGRLIRAEEIAETVAWLCGPESDSITGQAIAVAGGEIM
ncbi:MAG TPA: SDR family NAD(P)-dependent oxidoreductase [Rhizomicrobium sp.]|nr:SDR family NAD(P)-dependent oxidoreductase [Rhizomicrobium sp.]